MISGLLSKIVGSQLTKNYEVDKEPYLHGGLHNLWKIYRGKKKDRNMMDVSLFIFEKKILEKKKFSQHQKDEIFMILKKDAQNLAKLKHPSLLSLIEQPMEDQKFIIFVTEPVEFNLSSLQFDATKKDLIPGDLEIKCLSLELLEALNFLHNNAKMIHMGLAPEHVYVTKEGKCKLGGLNFGQQFSTAESINVPLNYDLRINEHAVVPNLRFAAPEISENAQCSVNSDLFSVGTLIYYMVALNKNKNPTILNQQDISDKSSHTFECNQLQRKFSQMMQGFDSDFEIVMKQLLNQTAVMRGPIVLIIEKTWFQDPLLKTIKYLETLDGKDHLNKVQFLQGITRILEKFDKKALLKKVIPLLLDQMKIIQLSVNVLPNILSIMERPNFLTTTEFREYIWPSIQKLCKAKELPAQSLFLIMKNTELFMKFVGPQEFQQNFLILINKSLECGVAKLQFLALTKVPILIKQIEYSTVKQSIIPRILMILEKPSQLQLKHKTLEILNEIISIIDQQTMKDKIMKTFEKVRATENDPQVCMLLLKIYEQMAKTLGVEEIGLKILPGIIPMLISGTFTRVQFKDMIGSVRRLLDQIEVHRDKDLRDMGQQEVQSAEQAFDLDGLEKSLGVQKSTTSSASVTNKDVFDFLSSLERSPSLGQDTQGQAQNSFSSFSGSSNPSGTDDIMSTMNNLALNKPTSVQAQQDPFSGMIPQSQTQQQTFTGFTAPQIQQQPKQQVNLGGWDSDLPNLMGNIGGGLSSSGTKPAEDDFFSSLANSNQLKQTVQQPQNNFGNFGAAGQTNLRGNSMTGLGGNTNNMPLGGIQNAGALNFAVKGSLGKNEDPFADLMNDTGSTQTSQQNTFGNFSQNQSQPIGGMNLAGFGQQQTIPSFNQGFQNPLSAPQQTFGQQQQQNLGLSNPSNGLSGLSFGQQQQQPMNNNFGGFNNLGAGVGFNQNQQQQQNPFGAFPQPKPQTNNAFGGDDFFSQFTSGQQQNQQKPTQGGNTFGNLF